MPLPASLCVPAAGECEAVARRDMSPAHAFHLLNIELGRVAHVLPREIHVIDPFSDANSLRSSRSPWELWWTVGERNVLRVLKDTA
jgi:hypothetical protein